MIKLLRTNNVEDMNVLLKEVNKDDLISVDMIENGGVLAVINGERTIKLQNKTVTANGEVTADSGYDGLGTVTVNIVPNLQDKEVTENGEVTADEGYDGLGTVTVNVEQQSEE